MANYNTNEFRSGLRIMIDGDPFVIVENEFVKPGKGQAFNRVKIKNLKTGRTVDKTFKSGDSAEAWAVNSATARIKPFIFMRPCSHNRREWASGHMLRRMSTATRRLAQARLTAGA